MPRPKKAISKKSSINATSKRAQKKPAKGAREATALHKSFVDSLVTLENHWNKKASSLKKQLDALRTKQEKAAAKQKAAKGKKAGKGIQKGAQQLASLQAELAQTRNSLAQAKLAVSKYAALSKQIESFEREWLKQLVEEPKANKAKETKAPAKKTKKASAATSAPKKRGRKPKHSQQAAKQSSLAEWAEEESRPAPKKRGRKPKHQAQTKQSFVAELADDEEEMTHAPKKRGRKPKASKNRQGIPATEEMFNEEEDAIAELDDAESDVEEAYEEEEQPELYAEEEFMSPSDEDSDLFEDYSS